MNTLNGPANELIERIFKYAQDFGTKVAGDCKPESDALAMRNYSWECKECREGDYTIIVTEKTKSGVKNDLENPQSYRLVGRTFQCIRGEETIIAKHVEAQGNWYPNPYLPETSESSMCLSRATGPMWVVEEGEDLSCLGSLVLALESRHKAKPA